MSSDICSSLVLTTDSATELTKVRKKTFGLSLQYHVSWFSAYMAVLFLNFLGSLGYFIMSNQTDVHNNSGITFALSIVYVVLFTPCSFICWYRPLYKAFR